MKKKLQLFIICALSYNSVTKSIEEEPLKIENNAPENSQRQKAAQEIERHERALQKLLDAKERASKEYKNEARNNFYSGNHLGSQNLDDLNPIGTMKKTNNQINAYSRKIAEIHNTVVLDRTKHISANDVKKGKVSHDTIKENVANAGEAIKASNKLSDEFMSQLDDRTSSDADKNENINNLQEQEKEIVAKLPSVEKSVFEELFDTFLDFFNSGDVAHAKNAFRRAKNKKGIADALRSLSENQRIDVINHIVENAPKNSLYHPTPTTAVKEFVKTINSILPANEQVKLFVKGNRIITVKA